MSNYDLKSNVQLSFSFLRLSNVIDFVLLTSNFSALFIQINEVNTHKVNLMEIK